MKLPKKPPCESPCHGVPKPILNAHSTHTTSTTANVANASIMLLTDQRFCITPPYRTASPGTLISPTSVAAVICQEVSPELSQLGASTGNGSPWFGMAMPLLARSVGFRAVCDHVLASSNSSAVSTFG